MKGRQSHSSTSYARTHPIILHGRNSITKLIIYTEHLCLLHAGPTMLLGSLTRRFNILYMRKTVHSITRGCITCRHLTTKPQPQLLGQLPLERITATSVFNKVGVDYAGPFLVKYGAVRKRATVKSYVCVFVCLAIKAVHLELVSDLTAEAFLAALRRFTARRGYPVLIWSDNGRNFVGAKRELSEIYEFLEQQMKDGVISQFCAAKHIEWKYIPEHSPHFGGIWEAAVKSTKYHLKRVIGETRLTFEELTTVLTQVESCLNSRPLTPINTPDDDSVEVLTPGHFRVSRPLCALPDPEASYHSISLLKRWYLCQNIVRHFRKRGHQCMSTLNK